MTDVLPHAQPDFGQSENRSRSPGRIRRILDGRGRDALHAGLGVLDQGVSALGSLIPVVLLGRMAGASDLGLFSLAVSLALFAAIISQSLFLSGYPIFRAKAPAESAGQTFHVVLFGLVGQAALVPIYVGLLLWTSMTGGIETPVILAATGFVTATALRSYLRTLSLVRRDMATILVLDTLVLLAVTASLLWLAVDGSVSTVSAFVVLAAANAAFAAGWAVSYARHMKLHLDGARAYLGRSVAFGRWALLGVGFGSAHYYLTPWLLAFMKGTEATAVYAAASTIVGLANHGFIGLTRGIEARTAEAFQRGGVGALNEALRRTAWIVLPPLVGVVALVWLAADWLCALVLPGHADEAGSVARLLSLALLIGAARVIAGNGLWAMNLPRATLPAELARGVVSIGAGLAGAHFAGPVGCAIAVLLADSISSLMVMTRYRGEARRRGG